MRLSLVMGIAVGVSGCSMLAPPRLRGTRHGLRRVPRDRDGRRRRGAEDAQRAADGGSDSAASPEEKVTRKLDDDDVLIKQGGDYLIGKSLGSQVLIVRTGQKVDAAGQEVIPVKRASKRDLKVGKDVYFTAAKGDVRQAGSLEAARGLGPLAAAPPARVVGSLRVPSPSRRAPGDSRPRVSLDSARARFERLSRGRAPALASA